MQKREQRDVQRHIITDTGTGTGTDTDTDTETDTGHGHKHRKRHIQAKTLLRHTDETRTSQYI